MKKIIFCLVLTMLFSVGVLGQRSVRPKPRKQPTSQQSWKTFFPKFKAAVAERDEVTLKGMMLETVNCNWSEFCDTSENAGIITPNLIFKELSKNNNRGWLVVKNFLDNGKEVKRITSSNTSKLIALKSNPECFDLGIWFEFKNKRWFFTGFRDAVSCRD